MPAEHRLGARVPHDQPARGEGRVRGDHVEAAIAVPVDHRQGAGHVAAELADDGGAAGGDVECDDVLGGDQLQAGAVGAVAVGEDVGGDRHPRVVELDCHVDQRRPVERVEHAAAEVDLGRAVVVEVGEVRAAVRQGAALVEAGDRERLAQVVLVAAELRRVEVAADVDLGGAVAVDIGEAEVAPVGDRVDRERALDRAGRAVDDEQHDRVAAEVDDLRRAVAVDVADPGHLGGDELGLAPHLDEAERAAAAVVDRPAQVVAVARRLVRPAVPVVALAEAVAVVVGAVAADLHGAARRGGERSDEGDGDRSMSRVHPPPPARRIAPPRPVRARAHGPTPAAGAASQVAQAAPALRRPEELERSSPSREPERLHASDEGWALALRRDGDLRSVESLR